MPLSSYPNGFDEGVLLREVLGADIVPRKVLYVGNNANKIVGEKDASSSNKGTFLQPCDTIATAYALAGSGNGASATDSAHDLIVVRPGYTLSIADATTLAISKANTHIMGLGQGEKRPIITFATDVAASIPITGANCSISNMVFKCNIASQTSMIPIAGKDAIIHNCDFREGTATGLNHITIGTADNDSDRAIIRNCNFYQPTAGNGNQAILIHKDMLNVKIIGCDIDGDWDDAALEVDSTGNACDNLQILDCKIKNRLTNVAAIKINGTGCSGIIDNCILRTDTLSSALDNGSLATTPTVFWADETDQSSATSVLTALDSVNNYIGTDNANNAASTSSVVANKDGSVLERLEAIMDPLGGFNPALGFRVTKTSNLADGAGTDNLFTVTGRCLITSLSGEVTTQVATTTTMKLSDVTNTVDLCAATTITGDIVGTMYALPGLSAQILNGTGGTPVVGSVPNVTTPSSNAGQIIGDAQAALTVAHVLDGAGTGAVAWILYYWPLASGATVVAAA